MGDGMRLSREFDEYLDGLTKAIGHLDRHEPLRKYCTGLMLPGKRKSVEPMAARLSPSRVSAEHQSLLHFVGQSPWDDERVLRAVREYTLPLMEEHGPIEFWIVDDSGMPKKGKHSVGVANQYCGVLGKNHNCQVAVSLSVANTDFSLPVAHRLYLPKSWANDLERRRKTGVPNDVVFAPKWKLALALIDGRLNDESAVPRSGVLADAGYGDIFDFRQGLTDRDLVYVVGIAKTSKVWAPGTQPQPSSTGQGQPPKRDRSAREPQPVTALELALGLPEDEWKMITWRQGSQGEMTSRFAAVRVRPSHGRHDKVGPRPEEWLLMEWPEGESEPTKYWLSTEPEDTPLKVLAGKAKARWRIERDYQDLKQEVGFGHYEGRGWRGFHHHTTLCIAAYAFLLAERARLSPPHPRRKPPVQMPPLSRSFRPRGSTRSRGTASTNVGPDNEGAAD